MHKLIILCYLTGGINQVSNPTEMITILKKLLGEPEIDRVVREGDIFAHLIQHFYTLHKYDLALSSLKVWF
jgi:hypothetical protein